MALLCAAALWAQPPAAEPELESARAAVERVRALVEAGAASRAQLELAEAHMADAEDAAFLRRTLYGPDLTEDLTEAMVAAAARRLDRRKAGLADARRLVDEKVASISTLTPHLEDLDRARKEFDLAESRARLCRELTAMAKAEQEMAGKLEGGAPDASGTATRFDGGASFTLVDFRMVDAAFAARFGQPLPVSAMGETAVHRALGFDHRDRVDVAVHPDQPEGVWLREYLEMRRIPYFAFRHAVRGKSTGAHIHIGPGSPRLARTAGGSVGGS
jgi:hypothetical protein